MNVMTAGMHTAVIGGKRETGQFLKGRASISALRRNVFPPASALPRTALIPAFPTFLNSIPYAFNFSATRAVVFGRSNPISGVLMNFPSYGDQLIA